MKAAAVAAPLFALICFTMPVGSPRAARSAPAPDAASGSAGQPTSAAAPVMLTNEQDHHRMMDLLHITNLPPGVGGNAANQDEAKANPYPTLPDPLVLNDGKRVTTAKMWWNRRRPEILELFQREIYGRTPRHTPAVHWQETSVENDGKTITKHLIGHVDNSSYPAIKVNIDLTLVTPANATGPVPVIMQFGGFFGFFGARPGGSGRPAPAVPAAGAPAAGAPPVRRFGGPGFGAGFAAFNAWHQLALDRGWGYATINPNSVQADNGAGLTQGIIGLCNKGQPRKLDDWGVLSAWAWGASRALDYFETDKSVDARQVAIEGLSRWGKAALVTMAFDPRFAIAYVASSGAGGAKLLRRNYGELVENLTASGEYHWFAGNFLKYAGHWNDLPVDSHELIALCAPRPVFITGGTAQKGDGWVDTRGMFMAEVAAGPVYRLLGKKDLGTDQMPPLDTGLITGDLGFRNHDGGHTDVLDFPTFLEFASHYFKAPPLAPAKPTTAAAP